MSESRVFLNINQDHTHASAAEKLTKNRFLLGRIRPKTRQISQIYAPRESSATTYKPGGLKAVKPGTAAFAASNGSSFQAAVLPHLVVFSCDSYGKPKPKQGRRKEGRSLHGRKVVEW